MESFLIDFVDNKRILKIMVLYRAVEQLVARWAHNPKATGSNPVRATVIIPFPIPYFSLLLSGQHPELR